MSDHRCLGTSNKELSEHGGYGHLNDMNENDMRRKECDVVVVGGGAAGLSAALVLSRARRRVAVVDAGAPRNSPAAHMQGYLSRDGLPPHDLLVSGAKRCAGTAVS